MPILVDGGSSPSFVGAVYALLDLGLSPIQATVLALQDWAQAVAEDFGRSDLAS